MPKIKPCLYWIDWLGYLWQGPTRTGLYLRFEGCNPKTLAMKWTRHKANPELQLKPYPRDLVAGLIEMYRDEAKRERAK